MSEMIDRVAKALNSTAYAPHEESWAKDEWPRFRETARRMLAVIREPTFEMEIAGGVKFGPDEHRDPYNTWTRMIDEALRTPLGELGTEGRG